MSKVALKLISRTQFYTEEGQLWNSDDEDSHSLHYAVSIPDSFSPSLAAYFVKNYSDKNDVVLDPFCGRGTVPLEAAFLDRQAFASDISPICARISKAKLEPVDIVEVALYLQSVHFNKPISLDGFSDYFEPFFDPDTYREIFNIRSHLQGRTDQASRFIEMVVLSILHGHTAGYLSAYSLPQISVSLAHQREMNDRRGKLPEYRAVAPRILRKSSLVLRDGDIHRLNSDQGSHLVTEADARNLFYLKSSSVDLIVTSPPRPGNRNSLSDQWLRLWFCNLNKTSRQNIDQSFFNCKSIGDWLDFMNSSLFEMARVIQPGKYAVLDLCSQKVDGVSVKLDELVLKLIQQQLSTFWEPECLLVNRTEIPQLSRRVQKTDSSSKENRVLVLRRR